MQAFCRPTSALHRAVVPCNRTTLLFKTFHTSTDNTDHSVRSVKRYYDIVMGGYSHLSPSGHFPRSILVSFVCTCILLCLCRALYLAACVTCIVPVSLLCTRCWRPKTSCDHLLDGTIESARKYSCAVVFCTIRICARVLSWRIVLQRTVQFDVGNRTEQSTTEFK